MNIVALLGDVEAGRPSPRRFPEAAEGFQRISLHDLVNLIAILSRPLLPKGNDSAVESYVHDQLRVADGALSVWPKGFHQYLHEVRCKRLDSIKYPVPRSYLTRQFPFLLRDLKRNNAQISDDVMDLLKGEIANYVEANMPEALNARVALTGAPSRWITVTQAARELGVPVNIIFQAEKANVIPVISSALGANTKRHFVERDQVWRQKPQDLSTYSRFKADNNLVSYEEAAKLLHVSNVSITKLVAAGYLETVACRAKTLCRVVSVTELPRRLAKLACPIGRCSRINLCHAPRVSTARLQDVLELALDGRLQLYKQGNAKLGLRRFSISRDELYSRFPLTTPEGYISVAEAARLYDLDKKSIRRVLRSGLLPSKARSRSRGGLVIKKQAFAAFHMRYVSSRELSLIYRIPARRISIELKESGAVVNGNASVWYRQRSMAILDRKFFRVTGPAGGTLVQVGVSS